MCLRHYLLGGAVLLGVLCGGSDTDAQERDGNKGCGGPVTEEIIQNQKFCDEVKGRPEVRLNYPYPTDEHYVCVDCVTEDAVYEGGLDKRSSRDSLHQVLLAAYLTGKQPVVVIYDTDGRMGRFEYQMRAACARAGVTFIKKAVAHPTSTASN